MTRPVPAAARARAVVVAVTVALAAAVVAGVLALVAPAAPAGAHSVLRSSDPADGAGLPSSPARVTLEFSDDVVTLGTLAEVTVDGGEPVGGEPVVDGARVVVPVEDAAGGGRYVVLWRVTSADGHPISGELSFDVAGAGGGTPTPAAGAAGTPTGADDPASAAAEPVAARDEGGAATGPGWLLAGVGAGALVAVGAGAGVLRRHRGARG